MVDHQLEGLQPLRQLLAGDAPVPIGRAIRHTETLAFDESLRPVRPGEVGDLLVAGAGLALGYRNRPELTAERGLAGRDSSNPGMECSTNCKAPADKRISHTGASPKLSINVRFNAPSRYATRHGTARHGTAIEHTTNNNIRTAYCGADRCVSASRISCRLDCSSMRGPPHKPQIAFHTMLGAPRRITGSCTTPRSVACQCDE